MALMEIGKIMERVVLAVELAFNRVAVRATTLLRRSEAMIVQNKDQARIDEHAICRLVRVSVIANIVC